MELSGRRVAVVGLGVENVPLARFLVRQGARVVGLDRKPLSALTPKAAALAALGVRLATGEDYLAALTTDRYDLVFLTPGMAKDSPEISAARARGARITNQTDLFLRLCPGSVIGVTGSSGKSTTTSLIGAIFQQDGRWPVYVGGNIGRPLIEKVDLMSPQAKVVLEMSSFQLELVENSPQTAVFTNLRPNHLDQHGSMTAYSAAKRKIYRYQRRERGDALVLNFDEPAIRDCAAEAQAAVTYFGLGSGLPRGATVTNGRIVLVGADGSERAVMDVSEIPLPGRHNVANVLAAIAATDLYGVPPAAMRQAVQSFRGLEHRLERIAVDNGVMYINDSIATAPDRTIAALKTFDRPIVWIAGGYDKGAPFDELAEVALTAGLRAVVLTGAAADRIHAALIAAGKRLQQPLPQIVMRPAFDQAVIAALRSAMPGDVVLLAPACASYDAFRSFSERGRRFREIVEQHVAASAG